MILKGIKDTDIRTFFDIDKNNNIKIKHFALKITAHDNPFVPHKHEQEELWFIIEGKGIYTENEVDYPVESNDLIHIKPWVLHGLKAESNVKWICLG